ASPTTQISTPSLHDALPILALFGIGESSLQQQISDAIPDWPHDVELGFRAAFTQIDLKLTTTSPIARAKCTALTARLQPVIGDLDRKSTRLNSSHVKISYAV